jgi:Bacterial SH3 domain
MAQRVAEFGKKPLAKNPSAAPPHLRSTLAHAIPPEPEPEHSVRTIPLKLAPLLLPYKKRGRLFLRVERLPPQVRLSGGRNNGDGTWSLASDELEDLNYLIPADMHEAHVLAVRVFSMDSGGAITLAVHEFPIYPDDLETAHQRSGSDEGQFAHLTANLLVRGAPPFAATEPAKSSGDEANGTALAGSTDGLITRKGHAEPSLMLVSREAIAQTDTALDQLENELRRVRDEFAAVQASLAERDRELSQIRSETEQEREKLRLEAEAALVEARATWASHENARLAAAKAEWQAQSAKELMVAEAHHTRAEAALKAMRAQADSEIVNARNQAGEEIQRLRDEYAAARTTLADRDVEISQLRSAVERACADLPHEVEAAVAKARAIWKSEEAARLAASEASWRVESAKALREATARWEQAESALKAALNNADSHAISDRPADELVQVREELALARAALAERDAELGRLGLAVDRDRVKTQQEIDAALRQSKSVWEAEEAQRLAAAEAQWREDTKDALAKVRTDEAQNKSNAEELVRLRKKLSAVEEALVDREAALAEARATIQRSHAIPVPNTKIKLRSDRQWAAERASEKKRNGDALPVRQVVGVAVLVASTILLYPFIAPYIPDNLRPDLVFFGASDDNQPAPPKLPPKAPPAIAKQIVATVLHNANVRTGPSTTTDVISTLQRGLRVAVIENKGNWTHVRFTGDKGGAQPMDGWVYSTFLQSAVAVGSPGPK